MKSPLLAVASACLLSAVLVTGGAMSADAAGSADPTPYTVSADGLQLPSGTTFADGGHVNIQYTVNGVAQSAGVHFESQNNQPSGAFVGASFLPWSYLISSSSYCITWVQSSQFNEHFGEGGQAPVCTTTTTTSTPTPTPTPTPTTTPTSTPTPTATPETPTAAPTGTPAPTPTETTPAIVSAPEVTASPSPTSTPTPTPTSTAKTAVEGPILTKVLSPTTDTKTTAVDAPTALASTGFTAATPIALFGAAAAMLLGAALILMAHYRRRRQR